MSWMNLAFLAAEAQQVIALRMLKLGSGGTDAQDEAMLMVSEKVTETLHAGMALMLGGSPDRVVANVRRTVRANAVRLAQPAHR